MSEKADAPQEEVQTGEDRFPGDPRLAEARLRARLAAEIEQSRALQQRLSSLGERYPNHYARLNVILTLSRLQEARGGEFPPKLVFLHMPDVILNIKRIGKLDPDSLTVGIEVHEYGDIRPGIVWVPVDQVMWAGTTNLPYGLERVTLEAAEPPPPPHEQYEQARRALAGLASPNEEEAGQASDLQGAVSLQVISPGTTTRPPSEAEADSDEDLQEE